MRILHYSLGFPPYRSGGLIKFCVDLMKYQLSEKHTVALLWPGRMNLSKKCKVKQCGKVNGIGSFEIINPLPVPLDEGIRDVYKFMEIKNEYVFDKLLLEYKPDIIHIHSLMGLPKEFLVAAKKLNIRTVFTTHDYFGICPKVTLFNKNNICINDNGCFDCIKCNSQALSIKKIYIMQSRVYRVIKNFKLIKFIRIYHRKKFIAYETSDANIKSYDSVDKETYDIKKYEYNILRNFYFELIMLVDDIHFNSSATKKVYGKYFEKLNGYVLPISHNDISDNRKVKIFNDGKLRITYLSPLKPFKGFNFLVNVLDELWKDNIKNFHLNIYGDTKYSKEYIISNPRYNYSDMKSIFENTDVLIVPSLWYETFGFTILEALSYGVPLIVSDKVGATDIIGKAGIIYDSNDYQQLCNIIKNIIEDRQILKEMNLESFNCELPLVKDFKYVRK